VVGTRGEAPDSTVVVGSVEDVDRLEVADPSRIAYITQTTLSLDDAREITERLRQRFAAIQGPAASDICYATQNRQNAVVTLARRSDVVLVVGSANSSNSCRLVEVAQQAGKPAYLVDDVDGIQAVWLQGAEEVGVTAGASAPELLVNRVIDFLGGLGYTEIEEVDGIHEDVQFALPPELVSITSHTSS